MGFDFDPVGAGAKRFRKEISALPNLCILSVRQIKVGSLVKGIEAIKPTNPGVSVWVL